MKTKSHGLGRSTCTTSCVLGDSIGPARQIRHIAEKAEIKTAEDRRIAVTLRPRDEDISAGTKFSMFGLTE